LIRCCSDCHRDADARRLRIDRLRRLIDPDVGEAAG
jgi:hypothetical protein